jgi:hypothetical protein
MRRLKLTKELQQRFLETLADTGSVSTAASVAGTSRTRVYELRKADATFAAAWQEAEEIAVDRLKDEARRRALEGVPELLISAGKLVRNDEGKPITVQRFSDNLLMALIKAHQPRREKPVRFKLPSLQSAADAPAAMASVAAAVAIGEITTSEAAELSTLVEGFLKAVKASDLDQRLQVLEARQAKKDVD